MALIVTKLVVLLSLAATFAHARFVISRPEVTSKHYKVFQNFEHEHPITNLVPSNLKIDESTFGKLMDQLDKQVTGDYNIPSMAGYFPKDVENDEWDELEFINNYDETIDDEDIDEMFNGPDSGASVSADFGKREFSYSRIFQVNKNGTKSFAKVRQSVKVSGEASSDISGNLNTTLNDATTASANFVANVSISSKGKDQRTTVTGDTSVKSNSKSKMERRRSLSDATTESTINLKISGLKEPLELKTSGRTDSETFRLPFRTFFTLFGASINTTSDYNVASNAKMGGEVTSHIAFASKNSSLTKSCIKVFVKTTSTFPSALQNEGNNVDDDDTTNDDDDVSDNVSSDDDDQDMTETASAVQVVLLKAKAHTWTKIVSASKSEVILDIITCTKARAYSKAIQKGKSVVFAGTGQVAWEKAQIKVTGEDLDKYSAHELGVFHVNKQLESGSLFGSSILGSN